MSFTLADVIQKDYKFSIFSQAILDSGLSDKLREPGPFTIFAPTDSAFAKLPPETMADLNKPENKSKLSAILSFHIIPGKVMSDQVAALKTAKTIQGEEIRIELKDGVKINGARLQARNVESSNGVIHSIDTVLIPAFAAKA